MEIAKGVSLEYKEGAVVLKAEVAALVVPALDSFKAKLESDEIDPIKGTDLDKQIMLKAVEYIKAEISK